MKSCRPLLGTYVDILVDHPDAAVARSALEAGFDAVCRVQRLMSVFDPESDISRLNRLAHRQPVEVDPWTRQILTVAQALHAESDGLFDCGVALRLAQWGMLPDNNIAISESTLSTLRFTEDDKLFSTAPIYLDLGGIAKGFAVDRATDAMQASGVTGGVINAGGDLRVFGQAEEAIYLRDPGHPEQLRFAGQLRNGACATSATYFSRRHTGEREISALIDPRSGESLTSRRSYSVIAPHCVIADALTKILALSDNTNHPCFSRYDAHPLILDQS